MKNPVRSKFMALILFYSMIFAQSLSFASAYHLLAAVQKAEFYSKKLSRQDTSKDFMPYDKIRNELHREIHESSSSNKKTTLQNIDEDDCIYSCLVIPVSFISSCNPESFGILNILSGYYCQRTIYHAQQLVDLDKKNK